MVRKRKRQETRLISIRLPIDLIAAIDEHTQGMSGSSSFQLVTRSDAVRELIWAGLVRLGHEATETKAPPGNARKRKKKTTAEPEGTS